MIRHIGERPLLIVAFFADKNYVFQCGLWRRRVCRGSDQKGYLVRNWCREDIVIVHLLQRPNFECTIFAIIAISVPLRVFFQRWIKTHTVHPLVAARKLRACYSPSFRELRPFSPFFPAMDKMHNMNCAFCYLYIFPFLGGKKGANEKKERQQREWQTRGLVSATCGQTRCPIYTHNCDQFPTKSNTCWSKPWRNLRRQRPL